MMRSVKITTPIPTLEEFGKSLGISKARQKALLQIIMSTDSEQLTARQRGTVFDYRRNGRSRVAAKRR
jgi:hypothetical protein